MKPIRLGDYAILNPRCSRCGKLLPPFSLVEQFETSSGEWVTAKCPEDGIWTPFKLEGSGAHPAPIPPPERTPSAAPGTLNPNPPKGA